MIDLSNPDKYSLTEISRNRVRISREYEPIQPEIFADLLNACNCKIMLDVGANIGSYTLLSAKESSIEHACLFEPTEESFGECVKNMELNNLTEMVTCYPYAISDEEKEVEFLVQSKFSGINAIGDTTIHNKSAYKETRTVQAKRLDDLLDMSDENIGIKIDVEGHELQAVRGAMDLLKKNNCFLQIEMGYASNSELEGLLKEMGYRCVTRIDPDVYFSNFQALSNSSIILEIIERHLGPLISVNVNNIANWRRAKNEIEILKQKLKKKKKKSKWKRKVSKLIKKTGNYLKR